MELRPSCVPSCSPLLSSFVWCSPTLREVPITQKLPLGWRESKGNSVYANSKAASPSFPPLLSRKYSCTQNSPVLGQCRGTCLRDLFSFQRGIQLCIHQRPQQHRAAYGIQTPPPGPASCFYYPCWLLQYHGGVGWEDRLAQPGMNNKQ